MYTMLFTAFNHQPTKFPLQNLCTLKQKAVDTNDHDDRRIKPIVRYLLCQSNNLIIIIIFLP